MNDSGVINFVKLRRVMQDLQEEHFVDRKSLYIHRNSVSIRLRKFIHCENKSGLF